MAEIPAVQRLRCAGCGKEFDDQEDVCSIPHVIGTGDVGFLCTRCHVTVLGDRPGHSFRQRELLRELE